MLSCETIQDSKSETKTKTVTTKTETKTKTLTLKTKTKTETVKILSQDCLETRQCLETSHHCDRLPKIKMAACETGNKITIELIEPATRF